MSQRVYISGLGAITAAGMDVDSTWQALQDGQSAIGPIEHWPMAEWEFSLGAEIKDFNPRKLVKDRKILKVISRQDVLGIHAADQAIADSGFLDYRAELQEGTNAFNDRSGLYVGSPGNKFYQQYDFLPLMAKSGKNMQAFAQGLFEQVHPMWLLKILPNNVLAYTGIQYALKGPNQNITNHGISGMQAIIEAYHAISTGQADRAVVVAYDIGFEPQGQMYYGQLGVLSKNRLNAFDAKRNGTILGEGAGAVVLESEQALKARGATPYAEVLGGGVSSQARGIFSIDEGHGMTQIMRNVLEKSQVTADDVGMICAHGNGNIKSDASEAHAISTVFGDNSVPVTAMKWAYGHTLCASGLIDTLMSVKALKASVIPGLAPLQEVAADCKQLALSSNAQKPRSSIGMVLNRAFGSLDACLLVRACEQV